MQYILIETEATVSYREGVPIGTSQAGMLEPVIAPGIRLYQCIDQHGDIVYKTPDGQPFALSVGSAVVDPAPPVPAWDVPEIPAAPMVEPTSRIITKLDYMNRFHDDELAALYSAAKTLVQIEVWLEKFKISEHIDLNDPRTIGGVMALEGAGLIAPGRGHEILA